MSKNLFITGTGTDVGKTYIAGLILKKLRESGVSAAYYKAAMSGNGRREDGSLLPGDALHVKEASGIRQLPEEMCPYVYEHAVSPHLASRLEGNPVRLERVLEGPAFGLGGVKLLPHFPPELFSGDCVPLLVAALKERDATLNGTFNHAKAVYQSGKLTIHLAHGGYELLAARNTGA